MHRRSLIALVALSAALAAFTPAAAQSPSAQVTPPIGLEGTEGDAGSAKTILRGGSSSIAVSTTQGSIDVWTLRIPCFEQRDDACVYGSSSQDRRSLDASRGTVSVTPRQSEDDHVTGLIPSHDTDVRFSLERGEIDLDPEDRTIVLEDDDRAPQGMRQVSVEKGPRVLMPDGGTVSIEGAFDIVSVSSIVKVETGTENDTQTEEIKTGWTWERGGDGMPWYHKLTLIRADLQGAMAAPWDGEAALAADTPTTFAADQATVNVHEGELGDAQADGSNTTLEDLEATVTGVRWNRASTDAEYPSQYETSQSSEGPVGWLIVEQGRSPTPPPEPTQQQDVSQTTIFGVGAAALATAALAAYYWPRLSWLGTVVLLPLYSRIEKDELFENDVREQLYESIQDDPGIHAHALAEEAGVGWGTTVYHLRRLERNGFVNSEKRGRYRRFFPASGFLERQREVLSVLQNETTEDIARVILEEPGLNQSAICEELDISPSLANWHLNRLIDAELVDRERKGRTVHYTPGSAWEEIRGAVDMELEEPAPDEAATA